MRRQFFRSFSEDGTKIKTPSEILQLFYRNPKLRKNHRRQHQILPSKQFQRNGKLKSWKMKLKIQVLKSKNCMFIQPKLYPESSLNMDLSKKDSIQFSCIKYIVFSIGQEISKVNQIIFTSSKQQTKYLLNSALQKPGKNQANVSFAFWRM